MTTPTKELVDPCLNCDSGNSGTCMPAEYDYPCNDKIRYLKYLRKLEKKGKKTAISRQDLEE